MKKTIYKLLYLCVHIFYFFLLFVSFLIYILLLYFSNTVVVCMFTVEFDFDVETGSDVIGVTIGAKTHRIMLLLGPRSGYGSFGA